MILAKRRLQIYAAAFSLAAAFAGRGVAAAQVYPGCAVPPASPKHVFTIDPAKGDDAADGSKAHPWKSLQAVFNSVNGASPLLSTVPYRHRSADGKTVVAPNPDAPIKPGDAVELMSGDYGDLTIHIYANAIENSDFVTIEAAPGQTPVVSTIIVAGISKLRIKGLKVQSIRTPKSSWRPLVLVEPDDVKTTQDIILDGLSISSQEDISAWSQEDWRNKGLAGIKVPGTGTGRLSCVTIANSKIFNVTLGAALFGDQTLFTHNVIDNFGDDALDYGANGLIISHNTISNNNDIGDGNHEDGMQGQTGPRIPGVPSNLFGNILIDSNVILRQTNPNLKFPTYLQGIDAFDEDWTSVTVTNNLVVTSACWGIAYSSLHGGRIINNTVMADNILPMPGGCRPIISVGDKTHEGSSSNDVVVRNNIANGYNIDNRNRNIVVDHNVCATIKGLCKLVSYIGGKPQWNVDKPGFYGDHNLADEEGGAAEFMNFDPGNLVYDLRLKPHAQAIGVGSPIDAPAVDITGVRRGETIDAGAYRHDPEAAAK